MIDEGTDYCGDDCHNYWRSRAEQAEAKLREERVEYDAMCTALARVRALLDEADGEPRRTFWPSEILAAIEGDPQ